MDAAWSLTVTEWHDFFRIDQLSVVIKKPFRSEYFPVLPDFIASVDAKHIHNKHGPLQNWVRLHINMNFYTKPPLISWLLPWAVVYFQLPYLRLHCILRYRERGWLFAKSPAEPLECRAYCRYVSIICFYAEPAITISASHLFNSPLPILVCWQP